MIVHGEPMEVGVFETIPEMRGFPAGRKRIKMRPGRAVMVYCRTDDGIIAYTVKRSEGRWYPSFATGSNRKGTSQ